MAGVIENKCSKVLWVVADGVAHLLGPKRRSPRGTDADGARAKDGTAIDDHRSWWKVNDLGSLTVEDAPGGKLTKSATWFTCSKVEDEEFGKLRWDETDGWGEPLA